MLRTGMCCVLRNVGDRGSIVGIYLRAKANESWACAYNMLHRHYTDLIPMMNLQAWVDFLTYH